MNLNKFLRKNSRTLLMVFMSFLLVAFLVPQSITGGGGGGPSAPNRELGEVYGETVTNQDLIQFRNEMQVLMRLNVAGVPRDEALLDMYLLNREARAAGIRIGEAEVKEYLVERGVTEQQLRQVQRMSQRSYSDIYDAVGQYLATQRLRALQLGAVVESIPRQKLQFRDQNQNANALFSVINAEAFVNEVPEPTDEQLQAFFDRYKAQFPNHGEGQLVFGYRYPHRVRVEYLTVDWQEVRRKIRIRTARVRDYFQEHRNKYTKPDPTATQPAQGSPPQVPMTFEEAENQVREDYRAFRAKEVAQSIVNQIRNEARRQWTTRGEDGFMEPPEGDIVSFEELAERFSTEYEVEHHITGVLDQQGLRQLTGPGSARLGMQGLSFPELALRVEGILAEAPQDGDPVYTVMEPSDVVLTYNVNQRTSDRTPLQAYLFRVVEVQPSAPPESLDIVRDQVVRDWKISQAFERAEAAAADLAARAREVGLNEAVAQATDLRQELEAAAQAATQPADGRPASPTTPRYVEQLQPFSPPNLTRQQRFIQRIGAAPQVVAAVFKLTQEPSTDDQHRVDAVASVQPRNPDGVIARWVVVQLQSIEPIYSEPFENQLAMASRRGNMNAWQRFFEDWFDSESIRQRVGFKPAPELQPQTSEDPEDAEEAAS